ncbi:carbon storage regulator [Pseudomonadales bacterium]|jgi:carbon storage regulator|nr:carbon storage regulator [Pseudomonadales bacterium]MDB4806702.1 carbon storage regulator [Pseudomonadales bacterium]
MALVLTRKENESVLIDGDILVTVVQSRDGTVKLAFEAPPEVDIVRTELLDRHQSED